MIFCHHESRVSCMVVRTRLAEPLSGNTVILVICGKIVQIDVFRMDEVVCAAQFWACLNA